MGMLASWSILNKVNNRGDARFLRCRPRSMPERDNPAVACRAKPRERRSEHLPHLMPLLTQGKVLVTNWHVFEAQAVQSGGVGGKVIKAAGAAMPSKE